MTSLVVAGLAACIGLVGLYLILVRVAGPRRRLEEELGLVALRARLARGAITPDEYAQARRALGR